MKKNFFLMAFTSLFCSSVLFTSCTKEDDPIADTNLNLNSNLTLNIAGLKDLGSNFRYEGWILVNGTLISTGTFTVNAAGVMSQTSFTTLKSNLNAATIFIVSIEPTQDTNTAISNTIILTGDFSNNAATLTLKDGQYATNGVFFNQVPKSVDINYSTSAGNYKLATRTDGPNTNEKSGIWFASNLGTPLPNLSFPSGGLRLPPITVVNNGPVGWKYEGWVEINGKIVSTGKFGGDINSVSSGIGGSDDFNGFSGSMSAPYMPGEDFLLNAPAGLSFPLDLSGAKVYVTLEPNPDNSPEPFFVRPLTATIPTNAVAETVYSMTNIFSTNAPTGTAVR
jgi:hypothetical protein